MEQFLLELVHRGLAASLLAVVVILLRQFFKKMPKWVRLVLWGFVAFRLLCPISLETSFSLMPDVAKVSRTAEENLEPEVQILTKADVSENPVSDNFVVQDKIAEGKTDIVWTEPEPDRSVQEEDTILLPSDSNVADVGKENLPVVDAEKETPSVMDAGDEKMERTLSFWPAMWLSGVLLMALYGVVSYLKVKYQVRVSILYKENIRYCDDIDVPFVFGLIKPHIYLPSGMEEDTAEHVLLHERQHLRRGDQWWKLLGFSLLSVYWFHPLLWVAYVLFCRDIEFACDEQVVKGFGEEKRREYAQALLSCSIGRRVVLLCPTAFGENGVKERIRSIMTYKKATFPLVIATVAVCLLVGVLFLTDRENPYKIETSDITMEGVALKQSVAKHMAEDIARLMGEAGGKRYKMDNFKFNFYELETESMQQLFRISVEADKTLLQSPEDSPLIAGMKKAQVEFTYEAEKEFAQRMIDSMVAQMESEKEQHICEPAIFATLKEDGGYELTYGNADRNPLKEYFDKENRKQEEVLGYLTVYQRAGKNPPMDTVGSYGYIYSKALNNPETKKYNERASYVFSPTLYYKEGVYSYLKRYDAEDKSELPWELLGEELTEVYSNHEMYWSERDVLMECTGGGTLYRIKGYEDTYRVAMVYEKNRRNDDYLELHFLTTGSRPEMIFQSVIGQAKEEEIRSDATTYHMIILERMNDLWFHEGREVFQQRMHLENAASVNGLSTEEELFWSLLAELYEATFIHPSSGSFPEFQGKDYRLLRVKDALGFEHSLVLYEGGYVKMTVNETELVVQIDEALCRLVMERIASYNIEQFEVSLEGAIPVEAILNQEEAYREVYETILDRIEMLTTTKDWQFFGEEGCYVSRVPIRYYEVPEDEVSGTTTLILFSKDFSKAASISLLRYADGFYSVNVNDTWNTGIQKLMQENPEEEFLFIDVLVQEDLNSSIMSRKSLILDEQNEACYVYPPGAYYLENDLYQKLYSDELAVSYEELTAKENLIWISAEKAAADAMQPMVFGADEVLKTGGLQAGEKIYFLQVIGKRRLDGENMCGIREIRVYDEGKLLQTVQMQEGIQTDGTDGIATGYTQCFTPADSVTLKDINFDGYPDLEVFGWIVNGNTPYYYWCWNPETERFEYAFCYQITGMDEERKLLVASHYAGGVYDMTYFTDCYRVTKNNKLELIESETKVEPFNDYQGWKKAYLDLIYYAPNNLVNPYVYPDYVRTDTRWYAKEKYLYLGLHDFDSDGTPELILGDSASLAVFTYKNGSAEKMVDITMECCWRGVSGVAFRNNTILISDHGSDGSGYVAWSYRDGAWVKAVYCEYHPKQCTINKEPATYEEFCEATSFDPKDWEGSIRPYGIDLVKIVREEETLFWEQESKTVFLEDAFDMLFVERK